MTNGIDSAKIIGKKDSPIYKMYYPPKIKEAKVSEKIITIGFERHIYMGKEYTKDVNLRMGESKRIIFFGATGSGKTWIIRLMMDLFYKSGYNIVVLTDVKDEFKSSRKPAPMEQRSYIQKYHYPTGLPMRIMYPKFLGKLPKDSEYFQFKMDDLTKPDMDTIYGDSTSSSRDMIMQSVYDAISNGDIRNFLDIYGIVEGIEGASSQAIKSFKLQTQILERNEVIGYDYNHNIEEILKDNQIPVLNLVGWPSKNHGWSQSYVAIFLRKLIDLKRTRKIKKPLLIIIDETPRFCPAKKNKWPSSKKEILEAVALTRQYGISMVFASQYMNDIPEELTTNSHYIFLAHNMEFVRGKEVLSNIGLYSKEDYFERQEVFDTFRSLKRIGKARQWLFIDRNRKKYFAFWPYGPLSQHMKEMRH